jgi:ATP-binding cassette subfamily B protein
VDILEPLLIQGPPEFLSAVLRLVISGLLLWWIAPMLLLGVATIVPVLIGATVLFKRVAQRSWGVWRKTAAVLPPIWWKRWRRSG